jgi:hypothetical protein
MNFNSLISVLNANKKNNFVVVDVRGKVSSAVIVDNIVKIYLAASKDTDTVDNVLAVLGKLDAGVVGAFEVMANDNAIVSAYENEDYVICKVS